MAIKNRLRHWRFKCEMDQDDFADFLGVNRSWYNQREKHPDKYNPNTDSMIKIWLKLKEKFPDIHLEDMWDYDG